MCAIYRLDIVEVLQWYSVDLTKMAADAASIQLDTTHTIGFSASEHGVIQVPLSLDPGLDMRKTTYLSRMIQKWGTLPLVLLNGLDLKNYRYAFIGLEDWAMYPVLHPGSLVLVDEGDGVDQGEILFMVAAQARGLVGEGEELRVGVQYG